MVGLGTFRPVKAEEITEHHMHSEFCMMDAETAEILNETRRSGGRIVCCGTTSCRTVESLVQEDGSFRESSKWTEIFIYPGYQFRAMDALITNFHLPESTLVMLVSAFAGREHILHAYETAVQEPVSVFQLRRCDVHRRWAYRGGDGCFRSLKKRETRGGASLRVRTGRCRRRSL